MAKNKSYKPTVGDLVEVVWLDANSDGSWSELSDIKKLVDQSITHSFGLIAVFDSKGITICMCIDRQEPASLKFGSPWFIPKKMIKNIRLIERKAKP